MIKKKTKFKETEIGLIPPEWEILSLNSLLVAKNQGVNTTTEKVSYSQSGVPVVRANNVISYKIDYDDLVYVDDLNYSRIRKECRPQNGDVLYTPIGSQFGSAALVKDNKEFGIAWNVMRMQPDNKKIISGFLVYLLNNPENKIRIRSLNASSTMPFVSGVELGKTEFIIPALDEQKQIVEILSSLDEKIEINRKVNKSLEKLASSLFKQWFIDFEFPDENGKSYISNGGKIIDSELGKIPEGWRVGILTDIADFQNGFAFYNIGYSEEGMKVVDLLNIDEDGNFKESERDKHISFSVSSSEKFKKFLLQKDDLVMAMTDMTQKMGILGKCGRIYENNKFILNQRIGRIRALKGIDVNYLQSYLNSDFQLEELKSKALGTVQKYVNTNHIKEMQFIIPTNSIMKKYSQLVFPFYYQIKINLDQTKYLTSIRDSLLPKLMSGKIRVK